MWTILAPLLSPISAAISTVVDRLVPDLNAAQKLKDEIQLEITKADLSALSAQLDIDKTEAASPSLFVAGPRPAFMWLCLVTLGWYWLAAPTITWAVAAIGAHGVPPMPTLSADDAQTALYGMLGLGAYRGAEKIFAPASNITKSVTIKGGK